MPVVSEFFSYYTDYFKIKIRLPKDYAKVNTLDGKGNVLIDKGENVEDGYYKQNIEWVKLDKNKTKASLAFDDGEQDKYYYFEFLDINNKTLAEYFIRVQIEVMIN